MKLEQKVQEVIKKVKTCAIEVYQELGDGWPEGIYRRLTPVVERSHGGASEEKPQTTSSSGQARMFPRRPNLGSQIKLSRVSLSH